jgi:hypothetical protein
MLDFFEQGKTQINTKELATKINKSTKQIKRYQKKYNINVIVFKAWINKLKQNHTQPQTKKEIDIRPFVQNNILNKIKMLFLPWQPSIDVLIKDRERKKEYLISYYDNNLVA